MGAQTVFMDSPDGLMQGLSSRRDGQQSEVIDHHWSRRRVRICLHAWFSMLRSRPEPTVGVAVVQKQLPFKAPPLIPPVRSPLRSQVHDRQVHERAEVEYF